MEAGDGVVEAEGAVVADFGVPESAGGSVFGPVAAFADPMAKPAAARRHKTAPDGVAHRWRSRVLSPILNIVR